MGSKRMTNGKYSLVAWGICTLVMLIGLFSVLLFALNRDTSVGASWGTPGGTRNDFTQWLNIMMQSLVSPTIAAGLGALIISRQPGHRIGWLLLLMGVAFSLIALAANMQSTAQLPQPRRCLAPPLWPGSATGSGSWPTPSWC